jgi:hypothetical protein
MSDYIQRFSIVHYTTEEESGESDYNAGSPTKRIKVEGDPHSCYYGYEPTGSPAHCWLSRAEYDLFSSDDDTVIADCTSTSTSKDQYTIGPSVYYSSFSFGGTTSTNTITLRKTITPKLVPSGPCTSTITGVLRKPKYTPNHSTLSLVVPTTTISTNTILLNNLQIDTPIKYTEGKISVSGYKGAYSCYVVVPLYNQTPVPSLIVNQVLGRVGFGDKTYYYYLEDEYEKNPPIRDTSNNSYLWLRQCVNFRQYYRTYFRYGRIYRHQVHGIRDPYHSGKAIDLRAYPQATHLYWDDEEAWKLYKYSRYKPEKIYARPHIFLDNPPEPTRPVDYKLYHDWRYHSDRNVRDFHVPQQPVDSIQRTQWIFAHLKKHWIDKKPNV